MKKTITFAALSLAISGALAQSVVLVPVTSVEPIQHKRMISVPRQVCGVQTQPVYHNAPVYQTYRDPHSPAPIVGMIVGAVVGYHAFGSAPGLGAMLGGAAGYSIGDYSRTTHPYWTGHSVPTVTYHQQHYCQMQYETMETYQTIGYRVSYLLDGLQKSVIMTTHPGSHIRLVTRVEH